ncbi:hypothetical protein AYO38_02715 [bacterium SCGC AG-212-C10]|nr:hypothetical protein AYO38_02715 [bacterium SCGC AG-212-C10]
MPQHQSQSQGEAHSALGPRTSSLVTLRHATSYRYDKPVVLGPQTIRLHPTPHCRTPISGYSLTVRPANHVLTWLTDPNGNALARYVFPERTTEFRIDVALTADLTPINPFGFIVDVAASTWPFAYDDESARELAAYTFPEAAGPALRELLAANGGGPTDTVGFVADLNRLVHRSLGYEVRDAPGVQTPEHTLERAAGSCRDIAWLMVQALRLAGFGARFVSGYLVSMAAEGEPTVGDSDDFSGLHAWAEVYLPGAGWIALDPTAGTFCAEGYIPLAATAHYAAAAPLTGSVEPTGVTFGHELRVGRG